MKTKNFKIVSLKKITSVIILVLMISASLIPLNSAKAAKVTNPSSDVGGLGLEGADTSSASGSGSGNGGGGAANGGGNGGSKKSSSKKNTKYVAIPYVSGSNPGLALEINEKSLDLDLAKTRNLRLRIDGRDLFQSIPNSGSFKIELYEVVAGQDDKYISTQSVTINRNNKNKIISIDAGEFLAAGKTLKFLVYDTQGNYVNTYQTEITAANLGTQPSSSENIDLNQCVAGAGFDNCQLDNFFKKVTFVTKKQKQATTRVLKDNNGFYRVTIPVPREGFVSYRGSRVRTADIGGGSGTGNGGAASNFGETIDASVLRLGESALDHTALSYDAVNDQLEIGFATTAGKALVVGADGKVGIGVDPATAFLHVRNGDTTTPSIKLNPGVLTTTPQNGAIEFDGSNLFFTKQGVRAPVGTGATGATGPQGPVGPVGPQGPVGTITANLGGTINGPLIFTKNGSIAGTNIPFSGTLNGGTLANTTIKNAKVSTLVAPDGSPDPAASVDNNGNLGIGTISPTEKLEVIGNVKATRFIGDGSGLTGIAVNNTTINNTTINGGTASLDKLILKPASQTNLTTVNPIQATGSLIRIQGATGPVDYPVGATQISVTGVVDGQVIVLKGLSNTNSVTLDDGNGLDLNGGVKFIIGAGDTITLVYDALTGNWIELTRTDV